MKYAHIKLSKNRVVTLAWFELAGITFLTASFCSKHDQFSKKTGRELAQKNLANKKVAWIKEDSKKFKISDFLLFCKTLPNFPESFEDAIDSEYYRRFTCEQ